MCRPSFPGARLGRFHDDSMRKLQIPTIPWAPNECDRKSKLK